MNAITAAVTAAKSTINRLLSNGNTDPKSGLIRDDSWKTYSEDFSGNEISVNYRREGKEWTYTATSDAADSTFFSKTGTARTLKEARLEALDAVVAGCPAQTEKTENRAKKELLKLMHDDDHQAAIESVVKSGLLLSAMMKKWLCSIHARVSHLFTERDAEEWASRMLVIEGTVAASHAAWATTLFAGMLGGNSKVRGLMFQNFYDLEVERQYRDLLAIINEM